MILEPHDAPQAPMSVIDAVSLARALLYVLAMEPGPVVGRLTLIWALEDFLDNAPDAS